MTEGEPSGDIVIYQADDGTPRLEVRVAEDTVWLSQQQLADLFQTSRTNVVEHIKHVYAEGELSEEATCRDFRQVRLEGTREVSRVIGFYNLDMIISVGYRVKSAVATRFRIWATERLREYLVKGFTMDDERLKRGGSVLSDKYFEEQLQRVREIRLSERKFYQKITDIYATSIDYDPTLEISLTFFKTVQNKMHWAAHGLRFDELLVLTGGIETDLLVATGVVQRVRGFYLGMEALGMGPGLKGGCEVVEETETSLMLGLNAAVEGASFLPLPARHGAPLFP